MPLHDLFEFPMGSSPMATHICDEDRVQRRPVFIAYLEMIINSI